MKWISIKDKLPPIDEEVLCFCPLSSKKKFRVTALARYSRCDGGEDFDYYFQSVHGRDGAHLKSAVTHWKPFDRSEPEELDNEMD